MVTKIHLVIFRHTYMKLRWLLAASFSEGLTSESHPEDSLCDQKYSCHLQISKNRVVQ